MAMVITFARVPTRPGWANLKEFNAERANPEGEKNAHGYCVCLGSRPGQADPGSEAVQPRCPGSHPYRGVNLDPGSCLRPVNLGRLLPFLRPLFGHGEGVTPGGNVSGLLPRGVSASLVLPLPQRGLQRQP